MNEHEGLFCKIAVSEKITKFAEREKTWAEMEPSWAGEVPHIGPRPRTVERGGLQGRATGPGRGDRWRQTQALRCCGGHAVNATMTSSARLGCRGGSMNSPRAEAAARLLPGRIRAAAAGVQGKAGEDQTPVEARGTWRAGTAMEKGTCLSSLPFEAEEALGGALVADRCLSAGGGRGREPRQGRRGCGGRWQRSMRQRR